VETSGGGLIASRGEFLQKFFCHQTLSLPIFLHQWHLAVKDNADN
jgi:hypothetical protein